MYTVTESEGQVEVCVNLTHPSTNIVDETVNVNVFNNESSVYIPDGAKISSMLRLHVCDKVAMRYYFQPRMFLTIVKESTPWLY